MIGHQAVRMHQALELRRELGQEEEITPSIVRRDEAVDAVVPALHHMQRAPRVDRSRRPRHSSTNGRDLVLVDARMDPGVREITLTPGVVVSFTARGERATT